MAHIELVNSRKDQKNGYIGRNKNVEDFAACVPHSPIYI